MLGDMWDKLRGLGNTATAPLTDAWKYMNTAGNAQAMQNINDADEVTDEMLAALADAEEGGAVNASKTPWEKTGEAMKALGGLAGAGGQPQQMSHSGGRQGGGGFQVPVEDQYAMAMKALVDKYGQFMFNKDF